MESLSISEIMLKSQIAKTPLTIEGQYQYEELPSQGNIQSALTLYLNDVSGLRLTGKINGKLDLECDSCLAKFQKEISIDLDEQYVFRNKITTEYGKSGNQEIQINDFYEEIDEEGELDLKDLVRQMLLLEISEKQVCGVEKCDTEPYEYWIEPVEKERS